MPIILEGYEGSWKLCSEKKGVQPYYQSRLRENYTFKFKGGPIMMVFGTNGSPYTLQIIVLTAWVETNLGAYFSYIFLFIWEYSFLNKMTQSEIRKSKPYIFRKRKKGCRKKYWMKKSFQFFSLNISP